VPTHAALACAGHPCAREQVVHHQALALLVVEAGEVVYLDELGDY
jgi:hypothetical protein